MRKIHKAWFWVLWLWMATPVFAVQMKSLYQAEVPVASQEVAARRVALKAALLAVLVKVSGNPDVADNPVVQAQLASAEEHVNEYGYIESPEKEESGLRLWAHFDPGAIQKLLREASLSFWNEERPLILFWVVNESPGGAGKQIITEDQDMDFVQAFKGAAKQYGLAVMFPLMDLTDMAHVTPEAVAANQYPVLEQAATRYSSGAILVGHVVPTTGGFQMTASLRQAGQAWQWDLKGKDRAEIAMALASRMAGILSAETAAVSMADAETTERLTVVGIRGAEDMTALTGYLQHLAVVISAEVVEVQGNKVVLELRLKGGVLAFNRAVSAGQRLMSVPGEALVWQWKG